MIVVIIALLSFAPGTVTATEEYSAATGKNCGFCHVDPSGGGELTASGKELLQILTAGGTGSAAQAPRSVARWIKLITGYIHILTGIFWFGTILYVHFILKPAYAAKGLPKGEVRVGLFSMLIMAVTGAILTYYRVPTFGILFHTRFGVLLVIKTGLFLVMVISALYVVLVIGPKLRQKEGKTEIDLGKKDLTPDELRQFDGGDGRPAYVAYQGRIYDVTASKLWKAGQHVKRHTAGYDLTEMIAQAPHNEEKILAMPEVGKVMDAPTAHKRPLKERVFYFMAYMNMGMVFLITLILALWRWW